MFEISELCTYCEPQKCYVASLWYGDVMLSFYSKEESRLEIGKLKKAAQSVLWAITGDLNCAATELVEPRPLWLAVGNAGCLTCYWADFRPAVAMCGSNVCIPLEKEIANAQ